MSFLELQGLTKRYGDATVVNDCSLSIAKGEFVCLLGPSGCGKTTTLQMVAGFVPPTRGRILLDGKDITAVKPAKRGLGIVFQNYALFPHMTVANNLAFGLEMHGVAAAERRQRVGATLELVHLGALAERYPSELSGGQRQRVAMARALVIQPPVLLLDEPMGALDAKLREEMQIELRALQHRVGITTIMVTHDQAEAMTLADRVVLMNKGCIEQVARPLDMYEQPNGRFSSTFLGKANVFEGNAAGGTVQVQGYALPCSDASATGAVDYIVRPEKIEITHEAALLRGRIGVRMFLGNHWLFLVQTPIGTIQLTQVNAGQPLVGEGDEVGLRWSGEHARVIATRSASVNGERSLLPYWLSSPGVLVMLALVALPLLLTLSLSLYPFTSAGGIGDQMTLANYANIAQDDYFQLIFARTFGMALLVTAICIAVGVPEAYVLSCLSPRWRAVSMVIVLGPLLISVVVRTLGWAVLLGNDGVFNKLLLASGLVGAPVKLMFTMTGVVIAMVHVLVPFMVLAVWASLQKLDRTTEQAAQSLGAGLPTVLARIVFPQVIPGVLSGGLIVFALAASAFATPAIIGGRRLKVVPTTIYDEFLGNLNWPLGAALAVLLVAIVLAVSLGVNRLVERRWKQVFQ